MEDNKHQKHPLMADASQPSDRDKKRDKKTDETTTVVNQSGNVGNVVLPQYYNRGPFLQKTHSMITQCDEKIAKWAPDGNRFMIMNIEKFEKEIIPQYFGHSNFSSFERQLNYYRFKKVQEDHIRSLDFDDDTKAYVSFMNENFKRDRPGLICKMQRSTKTKAGKTQSTLEDLEAKVTKLNQNIDALNTKLVMKATGLRTRLIVLERLMFKKGYAMPELLTPNIPNVSPREKLNSRLMSITKCVITLKEPGIERRLSNVFREVPCTKRYPDYYELIDHPISINDIMRKCRVCNYTSVNDFINDWKLMFANAKEYNGENSYISVNASILADALQQLLDKNNIPFFPFCPFTFLS